MILFRREIVTGLNDAKGATPLIFAFIHSPTDSDLNTPNVLALMVILCSTRDENNMFVNAMGEKHRVLSIAFD